MKFKMTMNWNNICNNLVNSRKFNNKISPRYNKYRKIIKKALLMVFLISKQFRISTFTITVSSSTQMVVKSLQIFKITQAFKFSPNPKSNLQTRICLMIAIICLSSLKVQEISKIKLKMIQQSVKGSSWERRSEVSRLDLDRVGRHHKAEEQWCPGPAVLLQIHLNKQWTKSMDNYRINLEILAHWLSTTHMSAAIIVNKRIKVRPFHKGCQRLMRHIIIQERAIIRATTLILWIMY